ncbi:MAG: thioredoxin family protein [Bacilli bacterium]|nr:thioredoxin family protein [Bacilli bacterium]
MKKILTMLLLMIILLITGCSNKLTTYEEITLDDYKQMIENKETFIFYIGSHNCSHCKLYSVKINDVIEEYQVKVYYLDIADMSDDELSDFQSLVTYSGTPTTIFVSEGKELTTYNRISGNQSKSVIIEKFKLNGYIEEE